MICTTGIFIIFHDYYHYPCFFKKFYAIHRCLDGHSEGFVTTTKVNKLEYLMTVIITKVNPFAVGELRDIGSRSRRRLNEY